MAFGEDMIDGYPDGEEPLVFHHKNGEFRNQELKQYRDMATGKNQPKRGLFRVLVNTKMNRMIFIAMMMCFGLIFALSLLMDKSNEATVNGVYLNLSAFTFDDQVYVTTSGKLSSNSKAYREKPGPRSLSLKVAAVNSQKVDADSGEDVMLVSEPDQDFFSRLILQNKDIETVRVTVESEGQSKEMTCKVESR